MIVEAALVELGVALLPRLLIRRELERGELVALPESRSKLVMGSSSSMLATGKTIHHLLRFAIGC
jgi:DNA-binding transcriptional LysR family regulator